MKRDGLKRNETVKKNWKSWGRLVIPWQLSCVVSVLRLDITWRHNGRDGVSNHQSYDCLLNRLFRRRSKKISNFRVTGLCAWNSPVTDEFPAQMASNAENVFIWWRELMTANTNVDVTLKVFLCKTSTKSLTIKTIQASWVRLKLIV